MEVGGWLGWQSKLRFKNRGSVARLRQSSKDSAEAGTETVGSGRTEIVAGKGRIKP